MSQMATRNRTAQTVAPKQSQSLAKNMTKLSLSSILSARGVFSPRCFSKKPFVDGISVDQLDCLDKMKDGSSSVAKTGDTDTESSALQEGALMQQWIECGIFDAIEMKYLRSVSLIISQSTSEDPDFDDSVIEAYTLKYDYAEDGTCYMDASNGESSSVPCSKSSTLAQAKQMIRNLSLCYESLPGLPDGRTVVIKLKYNDTTPDAYEPTYFRSSSAEAYSGFTKTPKRVRLGGIKTTHHSLSLTFTGGTWLFEDEESGATDDNDHSIDGDDSKEKGAMGDDISLNDDKFMGALRTQFERMGASDNAMQETDLGNEDGTDKDDGGGGDDDDYDKVKKNDKDKDNEEEEEEEEEEEDDDITRLDETEDAIDHSHLDDAVLPKINQTLLNYLEKRPSSSLGTIAVMCSLSEFKAAAELSKMASQGLVAKLNPRSDRWYAVGKPKILMEESQVETFEEAETKQQEIETKPQSKPESKKRHSSQVRNDSDMNNSNMNINGDLGGTSLSQESGSFAAKYSIVERPIKQSKRSKRR